MTTDTPPLVDIDGLLASGFTEGPYVVHQIGDAIFVGRNKASGFINLDAVVGSGDLTELTDSARNKALADANLHAAAPSLLHLAKAKTDECAAKDDRIAGLEAALREILSRRSATISFYDRNGPQWTSPQGNEYESTSDILAAADEDVIYIRATLNKGQTHE